MKKLFAFITILMATVLMVSCEYNGTSDGTGTDTTAVVTDTVKAEKDSLVQCKGITKRGTQCERMLWWPDTLCFQHVGQAKQVVAE